MDIDSKEEAGAPHGAGAARVPNGAGLGTGGHSSAPGRRTLVRHDTLPSAPITTYPGPTTTPTSASTPTSGSLGTLRGLVARSELNGSRVRFLRAADDVLRYVVEPVGGGEAFRVMPEAFGADS